MEGPAVRLSPNKFRPKTTNLGIVIPTGAERSGGTCGTPFSQQIPPKDHKPGDCHPDRSGAKWRDLRYAFLPNKFLPKTTNLGIVIPTGAYPDFLPRGSE